MICQVLSIVGCTLNLIVACVLEKTREGPLWEMTIHYISADLGFFLFSFLLGAILILPPASFLFEFLICLKTACLVISQLWPCCFAHFLYHQGKGSYQEHWLSSYQWTLYMTGNIIGYIYTFLPLVVMISPRGKTSQIQGSFLILIIAVILISFLVSLVYYLRGLYLMKQRGMPIPWMLLVYPTISLICPLPYFGAEMIAYFTRYDYRFGWFTTPFYLQGLLNAIAYGLVGGVREVIREKCSRKKHLTSESEYTEISKSEIVIFSKAHKDRKDDIL